MGPPFILNLFWLFFGVATSILMLWSALLFRHLGTAGARCMLIGAALELPCSLIENVYWNVWPFGILQDAGWMNHDSSSLHAALETGSSSIGYAGYLFFLLWMVGLLFVGLHSRARYKQQQIHRTLEVDPDPRLPPGAG